MGVKWLDAGSIPATSTNLKTKDMPNMSYCRYENTSLDMQDVVDTLYDSDCSEDLSSYERRGLRTILELAEEIVGMEDKINNILENQEQYGD